MNDMLSNNGVPENAQRQLPVDEALRPYPEPAHSR